MQAELSGMKLGSITKRVHEICEKIKKYLKNKDTHIDKYLAETFDVIRRSRMMQAPQAVIDALLLRHSSQSGGGGDKDKNGAHIATLEKRADEQQTPSLRQQPTADTSKKKKKQYERQKLPPIKTSFKNKKSSASSSQKPLTHSYSDFMSYKKRAKSGASYADYIKNRSKKQKNLRKNTTYFGEMTQAQIKQQKRSKNSGAQSKTDASTSVDSSTDSPSETLPINEPMSKTPPVESLNKRQLSVESVTLSATEPITIDEENQEEINQSISSDSYVIDLELPNLSRESAENRPDRESSPSSHAEEISKEQEQYLSEEEPPTLERMEKNIIEIIESPCSSPVKQSEPLWRREISSLNRHPPDVIIPLTDMKAQLVCGLCGGFIYNATTIAECMHTFCRKCLLFYIEFNKRCPTCNQLIDESNPYGNLRPDTVYQDIVNKLLPDFAKEEHRKKEEYYREQGHEADDLPPDAGHVTYNTVDPRVAKKQRVKQVKRWLSLHLQFIGYDEKLVPDIEPLECPYLRVPEALLVRHLQTMLAKLLPLPDYFQALILHGRYLLHGDMRMSGVEALFYFDEGGDEEEDEKLITLQYGIVPKGHDYYSELETDAELEKELDRTAPVIDESGAASHLHEFQTTVNTPTQTQPVLAEASKSTTEPSRTVTDETSNDSFASSVVMTTKDTPSTVRGIKDRTTTPTMISPSPTESASETMTSPNNEQCSESSKPKRPKSKAKYVWICIICNTEQCNIYCHLAQTHKLSGDERRNMSHQCSRYKVDLETGVRTPLQSIQEKESTPKSAKPDAQSMNADCSRDSSMVEDENSRGSLTDIRGLASVSWQLDLDNSFKDLESQSPFKDTNVSKMRNEPVQDPVLTSGEHSQDSTVQNDVTNDDEPSFNLVSLAKSINSFENERSPVHKEKLRKTILVAESNVKQSDSSSVSKIITWPNEQHKSSTIWPDFSKSQGVLTNDSRKTLLGSLCTAPGSMLGIETVDKNLPAFRGSQESLTKDSREELLKSGGGSQEALTKDSRDALTTQTEDALDISAFFNLPCSQE